MKNVALLLQLVLFALLSSNLLALETINNIKIEGNERISSANIMAYMKLSKSGVYDKTKADESVKSLFGTGFFENVDLTMNKSTLTVKIVENPLINKIAFEGNRKIKDKDILKELNMNERSVFSASKLQNDIKRMTNIYQKRGKYNVKIEPKIIKLDQNRINLVYEINEGASAKVRKIMFSGNKDFSRSDLSSAILSQESKWYNFFSSNDIYNPDKLLMDQELLKEFYFSQGYADFQVTSTSVELSPSQESFIINFIIDEGPQYSIGDIKIVSQIANIDTEQLYKLLTLKQGDLYNIKEVEASIDSITQYLGDHGYAFVEIEDKLDRNKESRIVNLTLNISESYKIYVDKINIINNSKTQDKVIRRELKIAEGDPFNATKVERSKNGLINLGYFGKVEFTNKRTDDPDKLDIEVDIEEKSTAGLNLAAGYSTADGPLGSIGLNDNNFLGKGQEVGIQYARAKKNNDITISFTEPYFLDYPVSAGFELFSSSENKRKEIAFDSKAMGGILKLGYNITENLYHGLRYTLKFEKVSNVNNDASIYVKDQIGKHIVSAPGHTLTYSRLDNMINPTKGYLIKLSQDLAGLGGNTKYFRNVLSGNYYYPLYKRDVILNLSARGSTIHGFGRQKVKINDRFFMGANEVRGFEETSGIGPRDKKSNDALGGTIAYNASAEVSFPIPGLSPEMGVKGVTFIDMGSLMNPKVGSKATVYNDSFIRASYGVGINWNSPLGLIRVEYGIPFRKKSYDEKKSFRLAFGTKF